MATLKQVSQDFDRCFRYRRFPSFRLAPLIILIFCGLVLLGSLFFEFDQNELFIIRPGNILSLSSCCQKLCFSFGLFATISVIRYRPPIMIITGFGILFPFYS